LHGRLAKGKIILYIGRSSNKNQNRKDEEMKYYQKKAAMNFFLSLCFARANTEEGSIFQAMSDIFKSDIIDANDYNNRKRAFWSKEESLSDNAWEEYFAAEKALRDIRKNHNWTRLSSTTNPRNARRALKKYGIERCLKCFLENMEGNGANTIGWENNLTTNQADAAINAGEWLAYNVKVLITDWAKA